MPIEQGVWYWHLRLGIVIYRPGSQVWCSSPGPGRVPGRC